MTFEVNRQQFSGSRHVKDVHGELEPGNVRMSIERCALTAHTRVLLRSRPDPAVGFIVHPDTQAG